jgi:glycosyltransferase involved in cell wall biosynthesis
MRVALFTETFLPKVDGIVTVLVLLMDHLIERGVEFAVIAPRLDGRITDYRGHPVIGVPGVRLPLYPELRIAPPTPGTYRAVKAFRPDIAHFIHPTLIGTGGLVMAKRLGVPALASFHLDLATMMQYFGLGFLEPVVWWYTRANFNAADYALAPSRRMQDTLRAHGVREVGLWRRGVDAGRFHPRHRTPAMRYRLSGGHPDDTLLLYVGRLSSEKQIDLIRPALDAIPGTWLAIVGDGPARAELEARFAGAPATFTGYLSGEDLWSAFASADIFVFPSAMETFGLVLVEAMAAGLPVVSSRVGGADDVITPGANGYLFDVGDVRGLIDGVRAIAADPACRVEMGRRARRFAESQAWPAMMDELIACYADLIAGRRPSI